jgi:uncharacterized protein
MKPSKYNFFFPYESDNGNILAYNAFSNALAFMEQDKYKCFMDFTDNACEIKDAQFAEQLKAGHFIIDDSTDELARLRYRMLVGRYNTRGLGLTIAPTADCNFRCTYCYEKDVIKPVYMNDAVQEKIVEMVSRMANTIETLSITWYGGEPLMAFDVVSNLSERFISICDDNKIAYKAQMITNGYLLTLEIAKAFERLKIGSLQITLDGFKDTHDSMRPLADGSGTFDDIMENLITCKDFLPGVILRINTDKDNLTAGQKIYTLLQAKGLTDKIRPYLGKIMQDTVTPDGTYDKSKCLNTCDFSAIDFDYLRETMNDDSFMGMYPRLIGNACGADKLNSYTIGADGKLYKCWSDIGIYERSVGDVLDIKAENRNAPLYFDYMLYDPTLDKNCADCNVLPICMGSCPYKRITGNTDNCTKHKYMLREYLTHVAGRLEAKNKDKKI